MRRRRGQSTVEYMLVISVISIAIGAVTMGFSNVVRSQSAYVSEWLVDELSGEDKSQAQVQQ